MYVTLKRCLQCCLKRRGGITLSNRPRETVPCTGAALEKAHSPNVLRCVVGTVKKPAEYDCMERMGC